MEDTQKLAGKITTKYLNILKVFGLTTILF